MKRYSAYLIPSLIASVFLSTYVIIDGFFIGTKMSDIGLSAINIGWPVVAIMHSFGIAIGISAGIYISMNTGLNRKEDAKEAKSITVLIALISSVVLGLTLYFFRKPLLYAFGANDISYPYAEEYLKYELIGSPSWVLGGAMIPLLKNSSKSHLAMVASVFSIFVNLGMDYVLIMVLDWGLMGAAIASVSGQTMSCLIAFFIYVPELGHIVLKKKYFKALIRGMIAPFVLYYSYDIILVITNRVLGYYNGNEAIAAYAMLTYMLYVINAISQGVGDGVQPLFSYYYGKNDRRMLSKLVRKSLIISFLANLSVCILFIVFRNELAKLYNLSDKSYEIYLNGVYYYVAGFMLISIFKVLISYFYSIGRSGYANIITFAEPFVLTPACYLLCIPFGMNAALWSYAIIQMMLFIISIYLYIKEKKSGRVSIS